MATIEEVIEKAINSQFGIAVTCDYPAKLRRKLYAWREKQRKQHNNLYDCLSFIVSDKYELQIVKRRNANSPVELDSIRHLARGEAPLRVNARGKSKPMKPIFHDIL